MFDINTFRVLLATFIAVLVYWLWSKSKRSYTKYNIPPFPVRPWPVVGHFFHLLGNLRDKLQMWKNMAGDIYSMDTCGQLHILVNDFNAIREIWVKHAEKIVNLQHHFGDEVINEINIGLVGARDENWKEQRSISLTILRNMGMGKNLMAEKIQTEVAVVIEKLAALKGQPADVKELFNVAIANIISSVCIGKRFEYDDNYFRQLIEPLHLFVKYFPRMMLLTDIRNLGLFPVGLFGAKKWITATEQINASYSRPYIEKIKQEFNENEEPDSFISAYLKEMKKMNDKGAQTNLDETNLTAIVRTLFAAGTDTTSTTILWCLIYLLHHPEAQDKIYREIEAVIGTERCPTIQDKQKLVYLNAFILETQRRASLVPIGFKREVSQTFEYGGFTFPKGCVIWPILDSVQSDKKIWGDPENFRPERFIDDKGALINREELIPFGIGRRVCLGESLAKMELFMYLAAIFQRFKIEPTDKFNLPSTKEVFGMLAIPLNFTLRFIDRKM